MSSFEGRNDGRTRTITQRENERIFDSPIKTTKLSITNKIIYKWTVRGQYLYFIDFYIKRIVVYSIACRRVERELQHESEILDFALVGDIFLVSVGDDFVQVWNTSDGTLLAFKAYEKESVGYITCIEISPTSFLYIAGKTVRRLDINLKLPTLHSTVILIEQVNTTIFDENWIWSSEVCGDKIALVFKYKKKLNIFDCTAFKITAQLDLSPHLEEGFQLGRMRKFDVSFPDRVVFCVGDSQHSQLKFLILDNANLELQNSFIVRNPTYSSLKENSAIDSRGNLWIDVEKSIIRIQYRCTYYYLILELSMDEEKITKSYGFHAKMIIQPNIKSIRNAAIVSEEGDHLMLACKFADTSNNSEEEIVQFSNLSIMQGPIEQLYQEYIRSEKRAVHFCEQLSSNLFKDSLFEFYCAHRLLMMGIHDGDIQKSPHHNGVKFKWHDVIYSTIRNFRVETPEESKEINLILTEAAKYKLIESASQYQETTEGIMEFAEQGGNISNMQKQLFLRLVQLETTNKNLDPALKRFKNYCGMTELMGIALNVIPFLSGSIAVAVKSGAYIMQGLPTSDTLSDSLQVSLDTISNSPTFEQGFLKCVVNSLKKEEVKDGVELSTSLAKCGITINQLQKILGTGLNGTVDNNDGKKNREPTSAENHAGIVGQSSTVDSLKLDLSISESAIQENKSYSITEILGVVKRDNVDLSTLEQWTISEFKKLNEDKETVRLLTIRQCSFFVAALMLLFDDDLEERFRKLQPFLLRVLRSRMISGIVLCDHENYSEEVNGILNDLKEIYPVNKIMTRQFMNFVKR